MRPEPDNPERDPALDAAWREHSAEMPPAALDAAILAAAHRAIGSRPRDAGGPVAEAGKAARAATGPQRWWMPLAAAATIGAIALGILQTVPQEHPATVSSVSDMPAGTSERTTALPPAPSDKLDVAQRKDASRAANEPVAPAMAPAKPAAKIVAPYATDSVAPPPAPAVVSPEPFPAEKKNEAAESDDFKNRARAMPPPAAAPAAAQTSELARADTRQRNEAQPSAPMASGAMALGKTAANADAASVKADDVDAWIVRIRKLHDDGKLADAAKELVALRKAVPDADIRLPPELRAWAATVKP